MLSKTHPRNQIKHIQLDSAQLTQKKKKKLIADQSQAATHANNTVASGQQVETNPNPNPISIPNTNMAANNTNNNSNSNTNNNNSNSNANNNNNNSNTSSKSNTEPFSFLDLNPEPNDQSLPLNADSPRNFANVQQTQQIQLTNPNQTPQSNPSQAYQHTQAPSMQSQTQHNAAAAVAPPYQMQSNMVCKH